MQTGVFQDPLSVAIFNTVMIYTFQDGIVSAVVPPVLECYFTTVEDVS